MYRGSRDHKNRRISNFVSKARYKRDTRNHGCRILMFMWSFGALTLKVQGCLPQKLSIVFGGAQNVLKLYRYIISYGVGLRKFSGIWSSVPTTKKQNGFSNKRERASLVSPL